MARYRPSVAAILQKPGGEILVAERSDVEEAWQFPQGGVDEGEDPVAALKRELGEEVGLAPEHYDVVRSEGGYRYDYPKHYRKKRAYGGQEQTYFLCRFKGTDEDISLVHADHQREFSRFRWIEPRDFRREWLPDFKSEVYARVMRDFFGVEI